MRGRIHRRVVDVAGQGGLQGRVVRVGVDLRVVDVELGLEAVVRLDLHDRRQAVALVVVLLRVEAHAAAERQVGVRRDGAVVAHGVCIDARARPARDTQLGAAAVRPHEADRQADPAVRELVDIGDAFAVLVAVGLEADARMAFLAAHGDHALRKGERVDQLVVDGAGQPRGGEARIRGLVDGRASEQFGGIDAQVDRPAVAGGRLLAAVQQIAVEVRAEAADVDVGRNAVAIALRSHAWQVRQRFGDGGVGQLADVFRRDRLDDLVGILLHRDRGLDAPADPGHRDLLLARRRLATHHRRTGAGLGRRRDRRRRRGRRSRRLRMDGARGSECPEGPCCCLTREDHCRLELESGSRTLTR